MARRGRPRKKPVQRCPRCGKVGWPMKVPAYVHKNGRTYKYIQDRFAHYDKERKKMRTMCYIPKDMAAKEEKSSG